MSEPKATEKAPEADLPTVKDLGAQLPIGIYDEEKRELQKSFTLRPYKSKIDRHLNNWRQANEGKKSVADLTVKLLSLIVSEAGGVSLPLLPDGDSSGEQEFKISQWYHGDVLYMWLYLRITAISEWMEIPFVCSHCQETGFANADLWSTEVQTVDDPKQLVTWVELKNGIKLRSGKTAKKVQLQPVTFRAQMLPDSQSKTAGLGYSGLRESVCAVDCERGHYVLTDEEIDEIDKIDQLRIDRAAGKVTAGPDLRTVIKCPKEDCGAPIRNPFDWTYDHFFDASVPLFLLE